MTHKEFSSKGGKAGSEKQREARRKVAELMRARKVAKRKEAGKVLAGA